MKKKVAIISAVRKKNPMTEVFEERLRRALDRAGVVNEYKTFCVVSERSDFNFDDVLVHNNNPLGRKWNSLSEHVHRSYDPDYWIKLDDDDLISSSLIEIIDHKINQGYMLIGLTDLYFYSINPRRSKYGHCGYWGGYKARSILGPARTCSDRLFSIAGWRPWDDDIKSGLDKSFKVNTNASYNGDTTAKISLRNSKTYCVDIKTVGNINGIGGFDIDLTEPQKLLSSFMDKDEVERVRAYREHIDKEYFNRCAEEPNISYK